MAARPRKATSWSGLFTRWMVKARKSAAESPAVQTLRAVRERRARAAAFGLRRLQRRFRALAFDDCRTYWIKTCIATPPALPPRRGLTRDERTSPPRADTRNDSTESGNARRRRIDLPSRRDCRDDPSRARRRLRRRFVD